MLRTSAVLYGEDLKTVGEFTVSAGQSVPFVLSYGPSFESAVAPIDPFRALETTAQFWRQWSRRCPDLGPWTGAVNRSLITPKALTYAATGGIVAAVTTSLPERLAGSRNWDYRFCWLRDSTFTLLAFMHLGYYDEAQLWRDWLIRAIAGSPRQVQIMYGIGGERWLPELVIPWLAGYEKLLARTHRQCGCATAADRCLRGSYRRHVPGVPQGGHEAIEARSCYTLGSVQTFGGRLARTGRRNLGSARGRQHFVHSKVMAWVAFDRAANDVEAKADSRQQWREIADEIHAEICQRGFDSELNSFVQAYGSKRLDARLLRMSLVGFLPPGDPRICGTLRAIEEKLLTQGEFVLRYESERGIDGLPAGEGAFFTCSFWLVDNYVLQGRYNEARSRFKRLLSRCNDVGLLAFDPLTGRMLGNFPQAYCHVGIINCALNLSRQKGPAEERAQLSERDD